MQTATASYRHHVDNNMFAQVATFLTQAVVASILRSILAIYCGWLDFPTHFIQTSFPLLRN